MQAENADVKKLGYTRRGLETLKQKIKDSKGAKKRIRKLQADREEAYGRAFDALVAEQNVLENLYRPLMTRLATASGTLGKLSFSVARIVDVKAWADEAEHGLIDLRKGGDFRGRGTLGERAEEVLRKAWETGGSADVVEAMGKLRQLYQKGLLEHSPVPQAEQEEFRAWLKRFAQWLYGMVLNMMAWIFVSCRQEPAVSFCCCCILRWMTMMVDH